MKFGRLTLFLLILFVLNVIISACGQNAKKKTLRTGAKTGSESNFTQKGKTADGKTAKDKTCENVELDDTLAMRECKKETLAEQSIAGKAFKATRTTIATGVGSSDGNFLILVSYYQSAAKTEACANASNGDRVVEVLVSVDLKAAGENITPKDITEDTKDLSLEAVSEDSIARIYDVKDTKKVGRIELDSKAIKTSDLNLEDLKFEIVDGKLVLKQDKVATQFEIQDEERKVDLDLSSDAVKCVNEEK